MTTFVIKDRDGRKLDATVDIEDGLLILYSRAGAKADPRARNREYQAALRLVLERLMDHPLGIDKVSVDSNRAQHLPMADRTVFSMRDMPCTPDQAYALIGSRMAAVGQTDGAAPSHGNRAKRLRFELVRGWKAEIATVVEAEKTEGVERHELRLPVDALRLVKPEHIWQAIDLLRDDRTPAEFGPSTDYDLVTELGERLPPKAVFGLAARQALGFRVLPIHFAGGQRTVCFDILREAGFPVIPKDQVPREAGIPAASEDDAWVEGNQVRALHLRRERHPAVGLRKKEDFRQKHGMLRCERCGLDPVATFGDADGEACIEVHHHVVQVADMAPGHRTKLEDLQCLCANCHRYVHRVLKGRLA